MSSGCSIRLALALFSSLLPLGASDLRVCADPNNLPFSNDKQQGFENALARLVAADLGRKLAFVWSPERGNYLQKTLNAGACDLLMGMVSGSRELKTTLPYYRSSYVFVSRQARHLNIRSFADSELRKLRIGVHVLQHEDASVPPARVLISHGLLANLAWYPLYPDFERKNPPAALIDAVARGEIDLAVAWGPLAGYFARHSPVALDVAIVSDADQAVPLTFSISMGVRADEERLLSMLNGLIGRKRLEINQLLETYGVPILPLTEAAVAWKR